MYLLDTNVVSELRKARAGKADKNVTAWVRQVPDASLFLSVIVVHELELGVLLAERRDAAKGKLLRKWLDEHVLPTFADRILSVDTEVALRSAALHVPDPRSIRDSLIAATALVHRMTIVTRNTGNFSSVEAAALNPWKVDPN